MEINSFYNTAKNFAAKITSEKPEYVSDPEACLCLIIADTEDIYSGITTVSINEGVVELVPAEKVAAMSLIANGRAKAKQMIVISFEDQGFFQPDAESIAMLVHADPDNGACEVVLSPEETSPAASLMGSQDFLSGFDDSPAASLGAPAEFASSIDVDESNPFNAPQAADNAAAMNNGAEPNFLYEHTEDAQQRGASGFPNNFAQQQGYPQQQPGYPQQPGFPQQPGYPQQQGFPQQGGYPQPGPYMGGGAGTHSSMYQQNMNPQNAAPYGQGFGGRSLHTGGAAPARSMYQQQSSLMMSSKETGAAYKKRFNSLFGDDDSSAGHAEDESGLSKADMLKQAKDKKKVAKAASKLK